MQTMYYRQKSSVNSAMLNQKCDRRVMSSNTLRTLSSCIKMDLVRIIQISFNTNYYWELYWVWVFVQFRFDQMNNSTLYFFFHLSFAPIFSLNMNCLNQLQIQKYLYPPLIEALSVVEQLFMCFRLSAVCTKDMLLIFRAQL